MDPKPTKLDYKKEYPELYLPPKKPMLIDVPTISFIMVDGVGAPESEEYQRAMKIIYSLSFTIKMSKMGGNAPKGYQEYVMPPLEGLWGDEQQHDTDNSNRGEWRWTSLLRQPDFVTAEVFEWAKEKAAKKNPDLPFDLARLEPFAEGLCTQIMHIGPYAEEPESVALLEAFAAENHLVEDFSNRRRHHEIYLNNPSKTKPERLKTVLRHPVKKQK